MIAVENAKSTTGNTAFFAVENPEMVGMIFKDCFFSKLGTQTTTAEV